MADDSDGTPWNWLAVAPVCKVKLVWFLIYDFQMDGVCGLSPTLVQIRKGRSMAGRLSFLMPQATKSAYYSAVLENLEERNIK